MKSEAARSSCQIGPLEESAILQLVGPVCRLLPTRHYSIAGICAVKTMADIEHADHGESGNGSPKDFVTHRKLSRKEC
jgi:hypothetical protein